MAGFDSKNALSHAIRYLADTAQKRAAGGWVHPKEEERQRKEQIRQETQQQREAIRMQKEHERKEKEAKREQERAAKAEGGLLLNRQFPTHYMPEVGRQVMAEGGMPEDLNKIGLYSKAARVAAALPQKKAKGAQMVAALRDPKRGVKKEELINAGLLTHEGAVHPDWADKSVTTDELAKHFKEQLPQVEERVLGGRNSNYEPKFETYTLPGGENYREVLLKSPIPYEDELRELESQKNSLMEKKRSVVDALFNAEGGSPEFKALQEQYHSVNSPLVDVNNQFMALKKKQEKEIYSTPHWKSDANVLAHIRMKDRTGPNGEKILHVEEIQSDWGQKGKKDGFGLDPEEQKAYEELRKKYFEIDAKLHQETIENQARRQRGEPAISTLESQNLWEQKNKINRMMSSLELRQDAAAPKGPYVGTTEGWTDLALKRVLKEAAEGGYDKIVVTPGDEQTERYNLADKVKAIYAKPTNDGKIHLEAYAHGDDEGEDPLHDDIHHPNDIDNVVGKEIADKIRSQIKFPEIKTGYVVQNQRSGFQTDLFDDEDAAHAAMAKYPDSIKDDLFVREATKRYAGKPVQLSGLDLKVGGQGMKAYYDKIVPSRLQALAKKHDPNASIGQYQWSSMNYPTSVNMHSLDVTPEMRQSILSGQEGYARGGSVSPDDDMIRDALNRIANPTSENPELAAKAAEIAQSAYKVPTENVTAGPSYYGFKGPMNVSDITTQIEDLPNINPVPKKEMSWEDFYKVGKGGTMINLGGDRSRLGRLTHINGKQLAWPVDLHAGPEYMLEPNPGAVWANAAGHTSGLRKKIQQASQEGPVYGVYTPMGPKTVDSSYQMFDALLSQIAANPPDKKAAKQFDDALKKGLFVMGSTEKAVKDREKEIEKMKDWPGVLNAVEAREHAKTLPGATRSLIVKYLDKAAWHKMGFPHVGVTRAAITNPDLLSAPANMMGHRIVELSPKDIQETAFSHNTYASPTAGKYIGDVPLVQRHYAMPDVIDQFLARRVGKNEDVIMHPYSVQSGGRDAARKMLEEQKQMQPISQRMLDSIQEGLKRQAKYGLRDGGKVEDREEYALGGNPADRLGGGYGTGNIGGGSSISSGGSMAEARAADRASVSGYSADSGGGSSWSGGGGGGRDSSPSIDRSTSGGGGSGGGDPSLRIGGPQGLTGAAAFGRPEEGAGTYNLDSQIPMTVGARLSPNIGADLVKEAVTPDFSTGNSPLASGVQSYDQNAINALYDRMREEQQAARDASVMRAAIGSVTKQISVPNASDLYGATNAPLAVNEKPSGMFGQPEFGTTQFGQGPMQSGFPSQSSVSPMTGEEVRQGSVPGMSQEALDWNRKMDAMQRQNQSLFSDETNQSINNATNKFLSAMKEIPSKLQEAQPLYAASKIPLIGGMIAKSYGLEELTPAQSAALYGRIYNQEPTIGENLDWSFGQRSGSIGSMPSSTTKYGSDLTPMSSRPSQPISPTPSTAVSGSSTSTTPTPNQTIRENFNDAFAAARARGEQTFPWTNPVTGQTGIYTTQLARKQGGRVPSLDNPDDWIAQVDEVEKPKRYKPQNPRQAAIVRRAIMLSSKKS